MPVTVPTLAPQEDDGEFAPENVTFAPKDVIAVDFAVRAGLQGLGYSGLDPALALRGEAADPRPALFSPHSDATSRLFGETPRGSRRGGGVAGQVSPPPRSLASDSFARRPSQSATRLWLS